MTTRLICSSLLALALLAATPPSTPKEEAVTIPISGGHLSGTLTLPPDASGPVPVALIIAGSGPTDRNGNQPGGITTDSLKKLADGLAAHGIATLRYDKRMIGESAVSQTESQLRFDDYVNDAIALANRLAADKRFSSVTVIGHSEGSLIGIIAAERDPNIHRLVSLEGAGRDLAAIVDAQVAANPANPPQLVHEVRTINASLLAGKTVADVDPLLAPLFRPSVQPYVISEYAYDPGKEIAKVKIPVLVVSGTHDLQILPVDATNLAAAAPGARVIRVDGMNHVLVDAPADRAGNFATYAQPNLPLDPTLVPAIAGFITAP